MCCEDDVHCGVWYWWGIIASRCTAKADGKRCLLMHVPAAPPSSSAQEKTTSLRDTEPHHSIGNARSHTHLLTVTDLLPRWQWEILEHLPYSPDVSMRLRSLRESERNTARYNTRNKLIRAIGRSIRNINKDGRTDGVRRLPNIWQKVISKGTTILKVPLWIKPCQKQWTVTFIQPL